MDRKSERAEQAVVIGLVIIGSVYNTIFHPVKMYRLVFQGVPWYD